MKYCPCCKQSKELLYFGKDKNRISGVGAYCKDCRNEKTRIRKLTDLDFLKKANKYRKAWNKSNPDKAENYKLRHRYGIDASEFRAMLDTQDNKCKICKLLFDGKVRPLIDHNHQTGKVRGLLCLHCNSAVGYIKENFDTALNVAKYIQEDQGIV